MNDKLIDFNEVLKYLLCKYKDSKRIPKDTEIDKDKNLQSYDKVSSLFKKHTGKTLSKYFTELGYYPSNVVINSEDNFNNLCNQLLNVSKKLNRIPTQTEIVNIPELPSSTTLLKIFKTNGYSSYVAFLKEKGFKTVIKRKRPPRTLTYEKLCELFEQYFELNKKYPNVTDCRYDTSLPEWRTVKFICGERFNEFYEKYGNGKNVKTRSYEWYCSKFKEICIRDNRILNVIDLINNDYGLPTSQWFLENCPNKDVKGYNDFISYLGFRSNSSVPKEFAIKQIQNKYNELNRPLKTSDFSIGLYEIGLPTIYKHWGTFNNMLRDLNLPITQETHLHRPLEELKKDIVKLCEFIFKNEGRKNIGRDDVDNCNWCLSSQIYDKYFKKELNITLCEFISSIGFTPNRLGFGMVYVFDDGEVTKSTYEYNVSNYLRDQNIYYDRDVRYNTFVSNYEGRMDCDYIIYLNNKVWYIEVAGMLPRKNIHIHRHYKHKTIEKYRLKMLEKIRMLESIEVNYKIIYPKDFKEKTLNEIFSFIFNQK